MILYNLISYFFLKKHTIFLSVMFRRNQKCLDLFEKYNESFFLIVGKTKHELFHKIICLNMYIICNFSIGYSYCIGTSRITSKPDCL